jgi:hypothetical protein
MRHFRATFFAALFLVSVTRAQTPPNSGAAGQPSSAANGQIAPLTTFTAQDGSATAKIPSGWQVTMQGQSVIDVKGPQGESIVLGNTFIARNAPYQPGKVAGVDLDMPYQANLGQKFVLIFQHSAGLSGKTPPQITFASALPVPAPPAFGQCGRFLGSITGDSGPVKFEGVMCSLPLDAGGTYKNIFKYVQVPANLAAQERATLEAVMASYSIPLPMLMRKLAPNIAPPPRVSGGAADANAADTINSVTRNQMRGSDISSECFSLVNLRETPIYQLPPECGGPRQPE